jgi:hypothetical protein
MCIEAMLGISLYNYPYLKLAKTLCLSYYCIHLLFNKIRKEGRTKLEKRGRGRGREWRIGGRNGSKMYAHMNK